MLPDEQAIGEAGAVETATPAALEAVVSPQDQGGEARDFEAEARSMGWVPETEWKGDKKPAKFLSAEDFVERGETLIPMLKSRLAEKDKEWGDRFAKLEKVSQKTIAKLQAQHEKEMSDLQAQREEAVAAGDVKAFRAIDKQIAEHEKTAPEIEEKPDPAQDNEAALNAWRKDNAWYETDDDLTEAAIGISQNILRKNPNITMAENLRLTTEKMRERFPLKLGKTGANGHAPVDSGSTNGKGGGKDPLAALPAEARAQAQRDMAQFPKVYKTAADWVKAYNS